MHRDGTASSAPVARPEPKDKLGFTAGEAADIFGKNINTIYAWLDSMPPVLRSTRVGRNRYIPRAAVYELLDKLELVS